MKNFLKALALGIGLSMLGHILTACDGSGNMDSGEQILDGGSSDAGHGDVQSAIGDVQPASGLTWHNNGTLMPPTLSCAIPSPTGDEPGAYGIGRDTPYFFIVTNSLASICNAFKAKYPNAAVLDASGISVAIAGIDCSDVAHDFQGSTGRPWCLVATAPDGLSACNGNPIGSPTCLVSGVSLLTSTTNKFGKAIPDRTWATCSPSGVFTGWFCTRF